MRSHKFAVDGCDMEKSEYQRPEGRLIAEALRVSKRSVRSLAPEVGVSDTRIRHIINGYQPVGRGQVIEIEAPADTLAKLAQAVGLTASDLIRAGRNDAAELLSPTAEWVEDDYFAVSTAPFETAADLLREYLETPPRDRPVTPPVECLVLWSVDDLLDGIEEAHKREVRFMKSLVSKSPRAAEKGFTMHDMIAAMRRGEVDEDEGSGSGDNAAATNQAGESPATNVQVGPWPEKEKAPPIPFDVAADIDHNPPRAQDDQSDPHAED